MDCQPLRKQDGSSHKSAGQESAGTGTEGAST